MKNSRILAISRLLPPVVIPALVLAASLLVFLPRAAAQNSPGRDQASARQIVEAWESTARMHQAIGAEKGDLKIGEEGIEFRSQKGRTVKWPFAEVQTFLLSPHALALETYENRKHHLGGMQRFRFDLDRAVPPELAAELSRRIQRPSQNEVPDPGTQGIVLPAHHRTLTGGTNGTLCLSKSGIDYVTAVRGDSRSWRWADLQTLSDPDPFHLLVFGYRDTYFFDLKEPLSPSLFYRLVDALDAHNMAEPGPRPDAQIQSSQKQNGQGVRNE
jgi:hypothetical protein